MINISCFALKVKESQHTISDCHKAHEIKDIQYGIHKADKRAHSAVLDVVAVLTNV